MNIENLINVVMDTEASKLHIALSLQIFCRFFFLGIEQISATAKNISVAIVVQRFENRLDEERAFARR